MKDNTSVMLAPLTAMVDEPIGGGSSDLKIRDSLSYCTLHWSVSSKSNWDKQYGTVFKVKRAYILNSSSNPQVKSASYLLSLFQIYKAVIIKVLMEFLWEIN